ncbi:MAG: FtsB family cell division protein [Candidatus Eutrophobiaceae bacterium]
MVRWFVFSILLVWAFALQLALWGENGEVAKRHALDVKLEELRTKVDAQRERNESQVIEVRSLREGLESIEERARSEMGMIGADEVFYRIIYADELPLLLPPHYEEE